MSDTKEIKWFGMKLTPGEKQKIETLAARRDITQKQAVMELVDEAVESEPIETKPGSFLDLSRDVCGSIHGPGDLSTNPKYMEGYGQS